MSLSTMFAALLMSFGLTEPPFAQRPKEPLKLRSTFLSQGAIVPGVQEPVYSCSFALDVDARGEGKGTMTLDFNRPEYDDYGDLVTGREFDPIPRRFASKPAKTFPVKLVFLRKGSVGRVNDAPSSWHLYRLMASGLDAQLHFAALEPNLKNGRLLVLAKDARVDSVIDVHFVEPFDSTRTIPCHPGCFPAGTSILTPNGTTPIEKLRVGDAVMAIDDKGKATPRAVEGLFATDNPLLELSTASGTVRCTSEQPLYVLDAGFRKAGEVQTGFRIWTWKDGQRVAATVREMKVFKQKVRVFNLVIGDSAVFVANGVLARKATSPAAAGALKAEEF